MAGELITTRVYEGDAVKFIVSHNVHRRHLTDAQRAMIAAKLAQRGGGKAENSAIWRSFYLLHR
ncbi:MAG: hypothetical protein GEV10_13770 [Streptosporangiales bacterium]|nr:hypothetical protein [Streptosporangiales bacterium]